MYKNKTEEQAPMVNVDLKQLYNLTEEQLRASTELSPIQVRECFKRLIKLIIHGETNQARDYAWQLGDAVLRTIQGGETK